MPVAIGEDVEQALQAGMGRDEIARAAFEELAPLGGHRGGILEVVLEQQPRITGVQRVDVMRAHTTCSTSGATSTAAAR